MTTSYTDTLTKLGLSEEQADIYESLLKHGSQGATEISKTTRVKRTYVYALVSELIQKGLAKPEKIGSKTKFRALSPDLLLAAAEKRKLEAELAKKELETSLPSLKSLYSLIENKPVVSYYEGIEGIKKVYTDTLTAQTPILALVGTHTPDPAIWTWLRETYIHQRIAAGIHAQVIVSSGEKATSYIHEDKAELRETILVPSEKYPLEHEINVYDNKLAIMNWKEGDTLLGIIIEQAAIATTFRSWFQMTWTSFGEKPTPTIG